MSNNNYQKKKRSNPSSNIGYCQLCKYYYCIEDNFYI